MALSLSAPKFNIVNTVQHGAGAESLLADNSPAILSMSALSCYQQLPRRSKIGERSCLIHR
jgi:hypothetical protein